MVLPSPPPEPLLIPSSRENPKPSLESALMVLGKGNMPDGMHTDRSAKPGIFGMEVVGDKLPTTLLLPLVV